MNNNNYDVIVIGGGPAGSTAATILAKDNRKVLLLEKEFFPRYHIGESLLPATIHGITKILGVNDQIKEAGFVKKAGGTFNWGKSEKPWTFRFSEQDRAEDVSYAYQVERSKFDEILLRNAQSCGVIVKEGCSVNNIIFDNEKIIGVKYRENSEVKEAYGTYVIDASGANSKLHNIIGNREYDPFFKNISIFGYFKNSNKLPGEDAGNVLTAAFKDGWCWHIPLTNNKDLTSVGVVLPSEASKHLSKDNLTQSFLNYIDQCNPVKELLSDAELIIDDSVYGTIKVLRDFSYKNKSYYKNNGILIGDAGCFIDPVFSSGVHLATLSGLFAARSINSVLSSELSEEEAFNEFEFRYRREFGVFYQFLMSFYDMHDEVNSDFWNTRKISVFKEKNKQAFDNVIYGLSDADEFFSSVDAFLDYTSEKSKILQGVTELKHGEKDHDQNLIDKVKQHTEAFFKERRAILEENDTVYSNRLNASKNKLRWSKV